VGGHPLIRVLRAAAAGSLPPPDGQVEVVPAPPGPVDAVVGFTAHLVVAADVDQEDVRAVLAPGNFGDWMAAAFLFWLGERVGSRPGSHDLVLAATGPPPEPDLTLIAAPGASDHPRVRRASRHRTNVQVFTDPDELGVLVLGCGLAGRWEFAFEVDPQGRNRGLGRRLALAARGRVPEGEPLFAQVAPGNAASVRSVLAAGFRPIGSEVLFPRAGR
jgi:GNAT superfamily N-acetyltransferase